MSGKTLPAKGRMYSLHDYARMIADEGRMGPYVRALQGVVRPGCVVADIGTGTGIFALVACCLGASRVYAIDTNEAVEVGRELARENGFADRIVFFRKDVRDVVLPERVDVIVSDLRGTLPFSGEHLAIIADVRARFLKPDGVLVPARDRLMVAVVDKPELHEWALGAPKGPLGVSVEAMRRLLCHAACTDRAANPVVGAELLSTVASWVTVEYGTERAEPFHGRAELCIERRGIGNGLVVWFETELFDGVGFSTAPGRELCYGRLFLPWPRPVPLSSGDAVAVEIWAQPSGEPWGWNSSISGQGRTRESFKQSTFLSWPSRPVIRSPSSGVAATLSQVIRS
jgi:type I protein arginine methyltransferase